MITIRWILMLAVLLYAGGCGRQSKIPTADKQRPAFRSLPVKYQTLLTTWISQDCRVDSGEIERDMASAGPILEEPLWEAFNLGPTEEDRADLQHSLRERYALRLRWLMQNGSEAVKSPVGTQLLAEPEEQFRATFEQAPQYSSLADQVTLAHKLGERMRSHPFSERRRGFCAASSSAIG